MKKILIVEIDEVNLRNEWDRNGLKTLEELIYKEMDMSSGCGITLKEINDLDDNILHPGQQL